MPPSTPKKSKRSITSRMIKAFGDFRKKKPATKQLQKPKKAMKTVRKPMPKKITPPAAPIQKIVAPKEIMPSAHRPTHKVEFHQDGLFIDGIKYKVLAETGLSDEELTIGKTREENGTTALQLFAMGRIFTMTLHSADIDAMLINLLKGRAHKMESAEGTVIRMERQMY